MFVVDLSSGYASTTGAQLTAIGAAGFIAYTGCDNTAKNITKARFQEYLSEGLIGALVIENGPQDVLGGDKAGAYYGQKWLAGAESVGYDIANSIGFCSSDFNETTATQYQETVDCLGAFGAYVPIPGYYGDGDSIDKVIPATRCVYGWQDNSTSFTPGGKTSTHARLQQRYADARAHGLPVDVNDVLGAPLNFMGENVTTPAADAAAVFAFPLPMPNNPDGTAAGPQPFESQWVELFQHGRTLTAPAFLQPVLAALNSMQNAINMLSEEVSKIQTGSADPAAVAAALIQAGVPTGPQISALIDAQLTGRPIELISSANLGQLPAAATEGASA